MAPTVGAVIADGAPIAAFDQALLSINSNPYFIGSMMLIMNLGGRFLAMEVTQKQEKFFQNPWVRRFLIFIVIFMGTRNILVAFWMTLVIILLIGYLFNENSSLCLFHIGQPSSSCLKDSESKESKFGNSSTITQPTSSQLASQLQPASQFTAEEAEIFKRLTEKNLRISAQNRQASTDMPKEGSNPRSMSDLYWQNMMLLQQGFSEGFRTGGPQSQSPAEGFRSDGSQAIRTGGPQNNILY